MAAEGTKVEEAATGKEASIREGEGCFILCGGIGRNAKPTLWSGVVAGIPAKKRNELIVRAEEVGSSRAFIDTTHVGAEHRGAPLVDADCHAFCQVIYKGIEGQDWDTMYHSCK